MAIQDATFGTFIDGGDLVHDDIVVGLRNGLNARFNFKGDPGVFLPLAGGTMSGAIDMDGHIITGLPAPIASTDAVNKAYADALVSGNALSSVDDANVTLTLGGTPASALLQAVTLTLGWSGTLAISRGGTGVATVTTSPTATAWAAWDANLNLSANNFIAAYTSTATAAANTILTVASTSSQFFTGSTTQTVTMPVVSTLTTGHHFYVVNNSSGSVTINSSGGNAIQVMAAGTTCNLTCILNSGTTAASWYAEYAFQSGSSTGTVNSGSINQLAWYASNGTAVSGLSTANSSVLVTSAGGVPSLSTTLPVSLLIPNPKIGTGLYDANGAAILILTPAAGTVANYLFIQNSITGGTPYMAAAGTDINIIMSLAGQGTGGVAVQGTGTNNAASAGFVGELIQNAAVSTSLVNNTAKTVTSITLTAGDWEIWGNTEFAIGGICTNVASGISTTNNTLPAANLYNLLTGTAVTNSGFNVPMQPISIASTTTYYIVAFSLFSTSTVTATSNLYARRRR